MKKDPVLLGYNEVILSKAVVTFSFVWAFVWRSRLDLDYFKNLQHSHPEWLCLCFKRPKRGGR